MTGGVGPSYQVSKHCSKLVISNVSSNLFKLSLPLSSLSRLFTTDCWTIFSLTLCYLKNSLAFDLGDLPEAIIYATFNWNQHNDKGDNVATIFFQLLSYSCMLMTSCSAALSERARLPVCYSSTLIPF